MNIFIENGQLSEQEHINTRGTEIVRESLPTVPFGDLKTFLLTPCNCVFEENFKYWLVLISKKSISDNAIS